MATDRASDKPSAAPLSPLYSAYFIAPLVHAKRYTTDLAVKKEIVLHLLQPR